MTFIHNYAERNIGLLQIDVGFLGKEALVHNPTW
jgi:hypothetical protein